MYYPFAFQIYLEAQSRNKQLKPDTNFLYQVFPGNYLTWQKVYFSSKSHI